MIDQFAFLISEGFKSFYRNKLASFLCVITIFINFSILGSLFVVGYNTSSFVDFFRSKYTFEIFLVNEVKQDDYLNFIDQLSKNKIIANTELIDKEKSAAIFKEEFGEDVVEMLGYNPLPLSIKVFISEESFEFDGVKFGNAIISKYKIVNYSSKFFTEVPGKDEKKLFIHAEIEYKDTILNIICTHLNYKYEHQQVRQSQVTELMGYISELKNSEFPVIICGDFNADPISDEIRTITGHKQPVSDVVLRDVWMITNPDDIGFTWSNDNHWAARTLDYNRRIDYIFIGKPGLNGIGQPIKSELVGTNCYENIFPSDHFGVMTHLVGK